MRGLMISDPVQVLELVRLQRTFSLLSPRALVDSATYKQV